MIYAHHFLFAASPPSMCMCVACIGSQAQFSPPNQVHKFDESGSDERAQEPGPDTGRLWRKEKKRKSEPSPRSKSKPHRVTPHTRLPRERERRRRNRNTYRLRRKNHRRRRKTLPGSYRRPCDGRRGRQKRSGTQLLRGRLSASPAFKRKGCPETFPEA